MIQPMTLDCAAQIAGWTYEDEYAVYSFQRNGETIRGLLDSGFYACLSGGGLIGFFCFGSPARIPTLEKNMYASDCLDVGLGLKPTLCGHGRGAGFMRAGLAFAEDKFGAERFRLTVAMFNKRAIRVYEALGFHTEALVTHSVTKRPFQIMTLDRLQNDS